MKLKNDNNIVDRFLFNLTLIFIFLKLFPGGIVNDWSWLEVLAPLWVPLSVLPIVFFVSILYAVVMGIKPSMGLKGGDFLIIKLTSYTLAGILGTVVIINWG